MVNERAHALLVELGELLARLRGERREIGRLRVLLDLLGATPTRNHGRDRLVPQNPGERELRERAPRRDQRPQLFDELEAELVRNPRERLPLVEQLTFSVFPPVIARRERGVPAHLAAEQARGERQAREDAHAATERLGEKELERALAKDVED